MFLLQKAIICSQENQTELGFNKFMSAYGISNIINYTALIQS